MTRLAWRPAHLAAALLLALLAAAPLLPVRLPLLFEGRLDSPGVLHLLALMLLFGAIAVTYDLLFGITGLLSFGHALYVALGAYGTAIAVGRFGFAGALLAVTILGVLLPLLLGVVCLQVSDIAFAMVTLAFAQAASIFVLRDPLRITGGELGTSLPFQQVPAALVGVMNTRNIYWVTLAIVVAVYLVARGASRSRAGRVWTAIRENETRVAVIGLRPFTAKLQVFVLSSFLATLCGAVYVLLVGGAHPTVSEATFTLGLLVMVVLGGTGTLWGALLGGMLYTYLDHRLAQLAASETVAGLPAALRVPLSEPLFLLGTLFVLLVLFLPGGLASLAGRRAGGAATVGLNRRLRPRSARAVQPADLARTDEVD